jgi:uncharacterized protein (DUF2062 family)
VSTDADSVTTPKAAARRKFWHRWFIDPVMRQLTQGVTPQKLALSLAVGSAMALFPILGTTTTLCVIAGVALGLNQPVIQGVNLLCTFVYFPLIVAFVRLGDAIAGSARSSLDFPKMMALAAHHPRDFAQQFGVTALHAMLGWAVVAPLWIPAIYLLALPPLRAAARRLDRNAQRA